MNYPKTYNIKVTVDSGVFKFNGQAIAADFAINDDGSPNTAHTTNLVPCFLLNTNYNAINNGKLGDIAPTILTIMGIDIPQEMTGNSLV